VIATPKEIILIKEEIADMYIRFLCYPLISVCIIGFMGIARSNLICFRYLMIIKIGKTRD